eukprot:1456678-Pyramimonas_sp.AAC.1
MSLAVPLGRSTDMPLVKPPIVAPAALAELMPSGTAPATSAGSPEVPGIARGVPAGEIVRTC